MRRTLIGVLTALPLLMTLSGCQSGGTDPLSCLTDADCPGDCFCRRGLPGRAPTCRYEADDNYFCGGSCTSETICPEGNVCRVTDTIERTGMDPNDPNASDDIYVYNCAPRAGTGGSGGTGGTAGAGGTGGSPTTQATESPVTCAQPDDLVAIADAYVRGGTSTAEDYQNTSYGTRSNLTIKSVVDLRFSRKIYLVFDISSAPSDFDKASLVLTLIRHIESPRDPENSSGPQPVDVYGITDNEDWDPALALPEGPSETEITWNNAPRNSTSAGNAFQESAGVPKLIPGYDFDLGGDGVMDEPGTKYALDITEYVKGRVENDADGKITILMAIATQMIDVEGSEFKSLDIPEEEMCDRPFLHFE